jgi:hypothetical protein
MKNIIKGITLLVALGFAQQSFAQDINAADSTGLAGDNFSLQGALELFKKSKSPEEFETALNSESNNVNNLDLNEDGKTDYIKVSDIGENKSRVLVLQVDINAQETQDVTVITIEKIDEKSATIQLRGAEELYGKDMLIEPMEERATGGKGGPDAMIETIFVVVNVWYWPCVQYVYMPTYSYWHSPWYWDYYPTWYRPWYVRPWRAHYHACYHYRPYYHRVYEYRHYDSYAIYGPRMKTAQTVNNRYERSQYKMAQEKAPNRQTVVGSERVRSMEKTRVSNKQNTQRKDVRSADQERMKKDSPQKESQTRERQTVTPDANRKEQPSTMSKGQPQREVQKGNTPDNTQRQPQRVEPRNDERNSKSTPNVGRENKAPSNVTPSKESTKTPGTVNPNRGQKNTPSVSPQRNAPQPQRSVTPQRSAPSPQRSAPAPSNGAGRSSGSRR